MFGLIVMVVVPVPVTSDPFAGIVSMVELSEVFLSVIFPVLTLIVSLKVSVSDVVVVAPTEPSRGESEERVGAVKSPVVKLHVVVLEIPA